MPRWISLLALCLLAFVGGTANAWAEIVSEIEVHETSPASEPVVESEEEEAIHIDAVLEDEVVVSVSSASEGLLTGFAVPPVPPPR